MASPRLDMLYFRTLFENGFQFAHFAFLFADLCLCVPTCLQQCKFQQWIDESFQLASGHKGL